MPSATEYLEFHAPAADAKFRVRLLPEENPDVVALICRQLPLTSVFGHVVVSGQTIWVPTRIVHLGRSNMVERTLGSVYLYAPGQTICLTYGSITESARVNTFGQIVEEDMPTFQRLGAFVWNSTVAQARRSVVHVHVRKAA